MGAPIALEMARQLQDQGEQVPMLFILGPSPRNLEDEALFQAPPRTVFQKLSRHFQALSDLRPAERVRYLWTQTIAQFRYRIHEPLKLVRVVAMRRIGLTVPDGLWHHYVGTIYTRARNLYAHAPYDGDAIIFSGRGREAAETLDAWKDLIRGDVHCETFAGDHLELAMDPELFGRWAQRLAVLLAEHQVGAPESAWRISAPPSRPTRTACVGKP